MAAPVPLSALDQLLHFLRHAPALFTSPLLPADAAAQPLLLRLHLPLPHHNEPVACVRYQGRFLISGTDLLRILLFRFRCLARPVATVKKFEEGVFSDLRNLKAPLQACLEPARSDLLDVLHRFGCVRTQKRQKVFYWDCVDHERLFRDAWEREVRREREAMAAITDPALAAQALAPLDEATLETAAVWHRTQPLLLTYVASLEDPVERPLNAQVAPMPAPPLVMPSAPPARPPPSATASASSFTVATGLQDPFTADLPSIESVPVSPLDILLPPVSLDPEPPVATEQERLMEELEAFLTPPAEGLRLNTTNLPKPSLRTASPCLLPSLLRAALPTPTGAAQGLTPLTGSTLVETPVQSWPAHDLLKHLTPVTPQPLLKRRADADLDLSVSKRLRVQYF